MRSSLLVLLAGLTASCYGFIGFGIDMYKPVCAFSCRASIASAPLICTGHEDHGGHHGGGATTPQCYSEDTAFLTTLANCMSKKCQSIDEWRLERYWYTKAATNSEEHVTPKWTYQETLREIMDEPTRAVNTSELLDFTGITPEEDFLANRNALVYFEWQETTHSRDGIILLVFGAGIPILTTALTFLPSFDHVFNRLKPYLLYPVLFGKRHVETLPFLMGNVPTFGQAGYIVVFFLLNLFFTALDIKSIQPNSWFESEKGEILCYLANRTGVLAFALSPLVILFGGRNNVLLWLTNWSHSTYLLLHRWVARIFTLQIVLHSILELVYYKYTGEYEAELVQAYWIWGAVATVASCVMLVISVLFFRRLAYEVFLVLHIILAAFVLIGSWYHVEFLFRRQWGYQLWLYAAFTVWFFDRILRAVWIARNGFHSAEWRDINEDIICIDVVGVRWGFSPGQHAYVYFPGAKRWTFWEAHPFSVVPLVGHSAADSDLSPAPSSAALARLAPRDDLSNVEKTAGVVTQATKLCAPVLPENSVCGARFYLRKHSGVTRALNKQWSPSILLEGPYFNHNPYFSPSVMTCDRIILLAGGIGVTGVLSFSFAHPAAKLYWAARATSQALVDDVKDSGVMDRMTYGVVYNIGGPRFSFETILEEECAASKPRSRLGVLVCGPASFCDDARAAVIKVGRQAPVDLELSEEAFSW